MKVALSDDPLWGRLLAFTTNSNLQWRGLPRKLETKIYYNIGPTSLVIFWMEPVTQIIFFSEKVNQGSISRAQGRMKFHPNLGGNFPSRKPMS
jgi:hypothetical protein